MISKIISGVSFIESNGPCQTVIEDGTKLCYLSVLALRKIVMDTMNNIMAGCLPVKGQKT